MCLNKHILFQTSKERVFLIKTNKRYEENPILIKRYQDKRDRGKKRKNEGERVRASVSEIKKAREKGCVCVGLHIIITHVNVRVTIFATKDTVIIFSM